MSETYVNLLQWLVILAFFLLVIGFMFAEAFWISKKSWASFGKGFVFSALSNFIGFAVGLFVMFVIFGLFLMFSLDGSLNRVFETTAGGAAAIAVFVFGVFLTPILLIVGKRVLLAMLKIQTGKAAWLYALVSSVLIVVVSLGVPVLLGYFIFR